MIKPTTFKKGNAGRPKGAVNKVTKNVKETVLAAFNDLQQDPVTNIAAWGRDNLTEFYKLAAKLIPTEISGLDGGPIIVNFRDAE